MALQKYKVCPVCGEHNPPSLLECRKCETDLIGIKVVDSNTEQLDKEQGGGTGANKPAEPVLVRICDCGAQNLPQARKCKGCGEDISDIMPTIVTAEEKTAFAYELKAVGDEFAVTLDQPVCIVGREAELKEYLGSKMYVSRQHARFTIVAEKVFVENLSNTNKTFINNEAISGSDPVALANGDEIGLGGMEIDGKRQDNAAYFLFRIKS